MAEPPHPSDPSSADSESTESLRLLEDFGRRLAAMERELADLRLAVATPPAPSEPPRPDVPRVTPARPPVAPDPPRVQLPPRRPAPPRRRIEPRGRRRLTAAELFGAKSLAWIGGCVTLLGIFFFFVLAVNRGWIGPVARVSLGAAASSLVFVGGLYLHRRFGRVHSAFGAVGAGIAGGYTTLLAAKLDYGLVPDWSALLVAAAIAVVAVATALAWSSELVAGLGLVGASLAPAAVGLQSGDLTAAGTAFAALVFAGAALVAVARRWQPLLIVATAASLPQAAVLVGQADPTDSAVVAVAAAFGLLYLAAGIALQRRFRVAALTPLPVTLVSISASFAGSAAVASFTGSGEGWALLAVAAVCGAVAAAFFARERGRELSALLGAVGLAILAFALADLLSGPALAMAWAADAAVLAWLARRLDEVRYQLASLTYLSATLVHALALDAPPRQLYVPNAYPAAGALAFVGAALAAGVVAYYCRPWTSARRALGILAPFQPALAGFRRSQALWRSATGWTGALAGLYASSLAVLGIAQWLSAGGVNLTFQWGHVAVAGLWGIAALTVLYAGLRWSWRGFRAAGLVWLGATLFQAVWFFPESLSVGPRTYGFLVVAPALLAGALLDRLRMPDRKVFAAIALDVVSSLGLSVAALMLLVNARLLEGLALLALAAFYCVVAALVSGRDRDLATLLWAPALGVGCVALAEVLDGTWLVLAWTAASVALAAVADRTAERRLQLAALAYAVLATLHVLSLDAPPSDFFEPSRHPEAGVSAVLVAVLGAAVLASVARARPRRAEPDILDLYVEQRQPAVRRASAVALVVLTLYAVSLSLLGLAEAIGSGSVSSRFHAGHAAVSAVWGVLALLALYAGLRKGPGWLQAVGFGLFAVSLAKIFLYDLTFLSSITRALSFLAVGAVLLLGGFFVQRLGGQHARQA
jgi:uncharacterized membrane protein